MALSLIGAIRSAIVNADLACEERVYRAGHIPEGAPLPYVVLEQVAKSPWIKGDGRVQTRRTLIQVDIWQFALDETDNLEADVINAVEDDEYPDSDLRIYSAKVIESGNDADLEPDMIHDVLNVLINHHAR